MVPVSVVIGTFNHKQYIARAIRSALEQTYPPCEVIVVDDGSTDGTEQLVRSEFGNRVLYHYHQNRGPGGTRNTGIRLSSGEWIAFLDSDDYWKPEKLERQMAELKNSPEAAMVTTNGLEVTPDGALLRVLTLPRPLTVSKIHRELKRRCIFTPTGTMIRRDVFDKIGWFPEDIWYGEDLAFFARLAASFPIAAVYEPLFYKTSLPNGLSSQPALLLNHGLVAKRRAGEALGRKTWPARWYDALLLRQGETGSYLGDAWWHARMGNQAEASRRLVQAVGRCPLLPLQLYKAAFWISVRLILNQLAWKPRAATPRSEP